MSEYRKVLEGIQRRVKMPEPAMERMLRRQERKRRNERIRAAVVALGIAGAGVAGAFVTLRVTGGTQPASGGGETTTPGGGFVVPTVAIWTAIVVLGLTVLAVVRLRGRFAHGEGGRGEAGPPPREGSRRVAGSETGTAKGDTEMESKQGMGIRIPQVEMPRTRFDATKVQRVNRWLIVVVVALAVAVVALGSLALVDLTSGEGEAAVPTPDPRTATIDALAAAWSGTDSSALEDVYAEDAVFTTADGAVYEGRDAIVGAKESLGDFQVARVSVVVGQRKYAAAVMRLENEYGHAYLLTLWKFNADGKIVSQQDFYGGS